LKTKQKPHLSHNGSGATHATRHAKRSARADAHILSKCRAPRGGARPSFQARTVFIKTLASEAPSAGNNACCEQGLGVVLFGGRGFFCFDALFFCFRDRAVVGPMTHVFFLRFLTFFNVF
jgi:hypothetical protein